MMRLALTIGLTLALSACKGDDAKPSEACTQAPDDQREGCKSGAIAMRDQLESLYDDFPATKKIDRVAKSAEELPVAYVTAWDIFADGHATPAAAIFVVTMDGKSYASYPTRRPGEDTDVEVPGIVEP